MHLAGLLAPSPWRLDQPPPGAMVEPAVPLLLQIDRRRPLAPPLLTAFVGSLSPQEQRRHTTLRLPADRERFLIGRGALRRLLGAWLELPPAAVPIESGPHGKPRCPGGPQFNVSHSGDLILLALHPQRPVGVDVEQARPGLDWRPIARHVLPADECEALERLAVSGSDAGAAEAIAADAFLAAWCRLEARLKAGGEGLAGLTRLAGPAAGEAGGCLWDGVVPAGYRAAVALAA